MKKVLCGLISLCMMFSLVACGNTVDTVKPTEEPSIEDVPKPETLPEEVEKIEPSTEPEETVPQSLTYLLYTPNENANGFINQVIETEEITYESVLSELIVSKTLPESVKINKFEMEEDFVKIDFSQGFADIMNQMGSSGELMIVGSVTNTFLNAFKAEKLYFTVDGEVFESGHTIYDFELTFFNITE